MFKGFAGFKKIVKGGFNVVAETSSQLADQVVNDPSNSTGNLKDSIKQKVQEKVATVSDAKETVSSSEAKEKAAKVAHDIKHYGAFSEGVLGYSDPTKEIRKAVKQKEKAAKKARKAKKKKGEKAEDLFDPENLLKYKKELEEKKAKELAALEAEDNKSNDDEEHIDTNLKQDELSTYPDSSPEFVSPARSRVTSPKEEKEEWQLFKNLTSGVDDIIQKKKIELDALKEVSYFQKKPTSTELEEKKAKRKNKTPKDKSKNWVDLENSAFEDYDGILSEEEKDKSDSSESEDEEEDLNKEESILSPLKESPDKSEESSVHSGLVEVPDIDPIDEDDAEDLFNTDFVDIITSGDVKLAVIPDLPTYEDEDDPFNTSIADEIIRQDKLEKRREETKLKFTGLSSVADVLSGKTESVDKSLVEVAVKKKRRRANRINLIAETESEVTSKEDIGNLVPEVNDVPLVDIFTGTGESLEVSDNASILATTPTLVQQKTLEKESCKQNLDVSEFEVLDLSPNQEALTSNVAILAGEFASAKEESEDEFDAAFDVLAKESVTKSKFEELEKQFEDVDIFDTSAADQVLRLASLTQKVSDEGPENENFFDEDKDPFDTSAFDDIAGDLEEELEFESLAQRKPEVVITSEPELKVQTSRRKSIVSNDPFGEKSSGSEWTAFKVKPKRPPPPPKKPPKPPPSPLFKTCKLDPANRPSVVVKAPSSESIKSWNCSVAENLLHKAELEAKTLREAEEEEEEFDPFDTTEFEIKGDEENSTVDPFDTSNIGDLAPGEAELKALKAEGKIDILCEKSEELSVGIVETLLPVESDPFDTDFASGVLPDKGDPFDTSYVSGGPGKAEIKALEEEFLSDNLNKETKEEDLQVVPESKIISPEEIEDDIDPFDTTIVDKVIPVRSAKKQHQGISVEDEEFDPTAVFQKTKQKIEEELDPFDTSIAGQVIPELKSPTPPPAPVKQISIESVDSDDFDPRAF